MLVGSTSFGGYVIYEIFGVPFTAAWADLPPNILGQCDILDRVLLLSKALLKDKPKAQQVLRHEICHGIVGVSGWGKALDDDNEEGIVTMLEYGLAPFWKELKLPPAPKKGKHATPVSDGASLGRQAAQSHAGDPGSRPAPRCCRR